MLLLLSRRLLRAYRIRRWSVPRLTQPLPGGDIDATLSDRPGPSVIPLLSSFGHAASYVSAARPCSTDLRLASFYWCRAPDMKNHLRLRCAPVRPIYAWHHFFGVDLRTCSIPAFTSRSCLADLRLASFQLLSSFGYAAFAVSAMRYCPTDLRLASFHCCRAPDMRLILRLLRDPFRSARALHYSIAAELRTCSTRYV